MNVFASMRRYAQWSQPEYIGDGGAFFRLALRGGLLQIVTLGFYRFWLLTDIRRRLWSSTVIDGDALEYSGRGRDLLIGFLIAMAILGPIFAVYFLIGLEAEQWKAFASLPLYSFLYVFGQYAAYRARRYRLSRTIWRGVRFWMEKGAWAYAFKSVGLGLVSIVTLGLYAPWRLAALERYQFSRTRYGDVPASFAGTGMQLFKAGIVYWMISVLIVAGVGAVAFSTFERRLIGEAPIIGAVALGFLVVAGLLALLVVQALYKAVEWRWFLNGVRFGEVRVDSEFPRGSVLGLWTLYALSALGLLIGFGVVFGGAAAILVKMGFWFRIDPSNPWSNAAPIACLALVYLLLLTVNGAVFRYFLLHRLWRTAVRTLSLQGLHTLDNARQAGTAVNAIGEGMLDGLDMGGF